MKTETKIGQCVQCDCEFSYTTTSLYPYPYQNGDTVWCSRECMMSYFEDLAESEYTEWQNGCHEEDS